MKPGEPEFDEIVGKALDRVADRLVQEGYLGFATASESTGFYFNQRREQQRRWLRQHPCMFPDCEQLSVKRSHTLSRSGPIECIAETGHVLTPCFDPKSGSLAMESVGVANASTFPGFCEHHESLFRNFEQSKRLSGASDHVLQFFRIVCRELRVKHEQRRSFQRSIEEHEKVITGRAVALLHEELKRAGIVLQGQVQRFEIGAFSERLQPMRDHIERISKNISDYERDFFAPLYEEIESAGTNVPLYITTINVPELIPVCLAGGGNFSCAVSGEDHDVKAFLNVWPTPTATQIGILVRRENEEDLAYYIQQFSTPSFRIVSMVEAWMIHGSDHWFIRPSVWNRIPKARQERLIADISDIRRNIGMEYERSIFDELRSNFITNIEKAGLAEHLHVFLDLQRQKLTVAGCAVPPLHPGSTSEEIG